MVAKHGKQFSFYFCLKENEILILIGPIVMKSFVKKVKFVLQNFDKVKDFFFLFVVKCQRNEFGRDLSNFCKF